MSLVNFIKDFHLQASGCGINFHAKIKFIIKGKLTCFESTVIIAIKEEEIFVYLLNGNISYKEFPIVIAVKNKDLIYRNGKCITTYGSDDAYGNYELIITPANIDNTYGILDWLYSKIKAFFNIFR